MDIWFCEHENNNDNGYERTLPLGKSWVFIAVMA